jgi:hypothetical protein
MRNLRLRPFTFFVQKNKLDGCFNASHSSTLQLALEASTHL